MLIWCVGLSFLLFQFFLQLSSGVILDAIMHEHHFSALTVGLLSSAFYYVYTTLQIPVGILFDRYSTRLLLFSNAALCAVGCFLFALGQTLPSLFIGRMVIGAGSAFAFVGITHLVRQHFPLKRYAFMIGLSETLSFSITVVAMIGMGSYIGLFGWRYFIVFAGCLGLCIAGLCYQYIPNQKPIFQENHYYKEQLILILKNPLLWINGLFACLQFSVITVFAAMWAVPFLQIKLACDINRAGLLTSMLFLGAGLSCPIFGYLSIHLKYRKLLIHVSCLSTAVLFMLALYIQTQSNLLMGALLFLVGLCCGAYMLAYSIAIELVPTESSSTCTGFINTLAMLSAPLLQPLVGYLLDLFGTKTGSYSLSNYQNALLVVPAALILASILAQFLPSKQSTTTVL